MKINKDKFRARLKQSGLSREELATALVRPGLSERRAPSAVGNWLAGRDHPRVKTEDIENLARALGCQPRELVRFVTRARFMRSSPRKAQLLAELIRGKRVDEAMDALAFNKRRAATMVSKALKAAIADAEQAEADVERLVVTESRIDSGPIIKRFQPKDRGRAHPIQKKTSHIVVGVEEMA